MSQNEDQAFEDWGRFVDCEAWGRTLLVLHAPGDPAGEGVSLVARHPERGRIEAAAACASRAEARALLAELDGPRAQQLLLASLEPPAPPAPSDAQRFWDGQFATEDYAYGTEPNSYLAARAAALPPGGRVLCLADGEGRNSVYLASLGHEVTGVDISPAGLAKARALAAERGVQIHGVHADLTGYDLGEGAWDAIVSIYCHLPSAERADLHRRVTRALRPGGAYLLEAYTPAQLGRGTGGPPVADMMMSMQTLVSELPTLHFEHLAELERDVIEGRNHTGHAAVVQALARRPPI